MTNLIKEWRRIKHSPQYGGNDEKHGALRTVMAERSRIPSHECKQRVHVLVAMKRLIRHGVLMANAHSGYFDKTEGVWSTHPERYQFLGTAKKWLEAAYGMSTLHIQRDSGLIPHLDQLGYVMWGGAIVAKRDAVKGYGGAYFNRRYAEETFAGWAALTSVVEIAALPKEYRAAARTWAAAHPRDDGCVRAPDQLIQMDKLNFENGAWRNPPPPKPFNVTHIGGYHSSARHLKSLDHLDKGIRIGLEVELACPEGRRGSATGVSAAKFLNKYVHSRYALVERDRSVDNGFELVISPASVEFHKTKLLALADIWRRLGERVNPFKRCNNTDSSAGIHIHIDKRSVRNWAALNHFINAKKLSADYGGTWRKALFGREAGFYCQEYDNTTEPQSKYSAINNMHTATYEARVFSSSNDPKEWVAHIEVLTAMVAWTNGMLMCTPERLTVAAFLKFLFANWEEYPLAYGRGFELHRRETLDRIANADKDKPGYEVISYDECEDTHA